MPELLYYFWKRDPKWRISDGGQHTVGEILGNVCQLWKPAVLVRNRPAYAEPCREDKGEMITITMWVILMMLAAIMNGLALLLGIDEMTQFSRFMNWITFAGLAVKLILTGLWYMLTKRHPIK